jgi:hypothetical protein
MDEAAWGLCQWVVTEAKPGGALSRSRKKRALAMDSYRFLHTEAYLEFHAERRSKLEAEERAAKSGGSTVAPTADKTAASIAFILQQLHDPEVPAERKHQIRTKWIDANPGERPPWDGNGTDRGAESAQA